MYVLPALEKGLNAIADFLFPAWCLSCKSPQTSYRPLCSDCFADLGFDLSEKPFSQNSTIVFNDSYAAHTLLSLAYQREDFYELLAAFLVCHIIKSGFPVPDCIIPIPDTQIKMFNEGYRFSFHLAKAVGKFFEAEVLDCFTCDSGFFPEVGPYEFSWKKQVDIVDKVVLVVDESFLAERIAAFNKRVEEGMPKGIYGALLVDFGRYEK
jgi:hypothetical protein